MAFEGNLKDFSLADVFRLIASGKKSGTLFLESEEMEGKVCFRDGNIFFASSTQSHEPIGSRLVTARVITEQQLERALDVQEAEKADAGGRRLGRILIDEGYFDELVLERFVREQIIDTLFDLFRWDEGVIRFDATDCANDEDIGLSAPVEAIIEEASRRLDQWDKMGSCIPSLDARFLMSTEPAERSTEIYLKPREWLLLCHLHGGRGIRELAEASGYSYFETARTLYGMVSAGLIATFEEVDLASSAEKSAEAEQATAVAV